MKRVQISVTDEYLLSAGQERAQKLDMTFSVYVAHLIAEDCKNALQGEITGYYSNGKTHSEKEFYSMQDFSCSLQAYRELLKSGSSIYDGSRLIGYSAATGTGFSESRGELW